VSVASEGLKFLGADVVEIPASAASKMPDFLAVFGSSRVLVEEKDKHDRPEDVTRRREAFGRGEVYGSSLPITPNNRISGIVKSAASQLSSPAAPPHDFRVIWYNALGPNAAGKIRQFCDTMYGRQVLWEEGKSHLTECYFFRHSSFFTHKEVLDGAICAEVQGDSAECKLLVNPLSPRYPDILTSELVRAFRGAVEDPKQLEAAGDCYMMDAEVDRTKENALITALQAKYDLGRLMTFSLNHLSAEMAFPKG
jgi:hypothetical protein